MSLLEFKDVRVEFKIPSGIVTAVDKVSFTIEQGETLAVVGESGSGKSQSMLAALGLLARNGKVSGSIKFDGEELVGMPQSKLNKIRGNQVSMIFQDPMTSLNPYMRVADQMTEVLELHKGMSRSDALKRSEQMLDAVRLPDAKRVLNRYPHELSGGMRQRVMIAIALLCDPKVLIADEPTTALDVTVQAQMLDLFKKLGEEFGTALVMITHDLGVVAGLADRMMVMYAGRIVEEGTVDDIFYNTEHPYTFGLMHSTPHMETHGARLDPISGLPPNLENLPTGCAFHPRCAYRMPQCVAETPELEGPYGAHRAACFYEGDLERNEEAAQ